MVHDRSRPKVRERCSLFSLQPLSVTNSAPAGSSSFAVPVVRGGGFLNERGGPGSSGRTYFSGRDGRDVHRKAWSSLNSRRRLETADDHSRVFLKVFRVGPACIRIDEAPAYDAAAQRQIRLRLRSFSSAASKAVRPLQQQQGCFCRRLHPRNL